MIPTEFFSNMLSWWQWLVFGLVPPAIVALYFLKLRRQPLEVPSTYLWHRTIEDLHVNSFWQRLRQNLLLFLQLLLIALLMLACLRPSWRARKLVEDRVIFLLDTSASMSATDVQPSRLDAARQRIDDLISQLKPGDAAMLVSFSDRARIEQPFTTNQSLLRARLKAIQPTQRLSDIGEALRVAAGLANPGRSGEAGTQDVQVAEAQPADVIVLSDGGFRGVPDFSWGNLRPIYVPLGTEDAANVAIVACSAETTPARPDRMQAFVQLENFSETQRQVELTLTLDDQLLDAATLAIPPRDTAGTEFRFATVPSGVLKVAIETPDALALDNVAYVALNRPRRSRVLLVTPGNDVLVTALSTEDALQLGELAVEAPEALGTVAYRTRAAAGFYDLVIYDRCRPEEMPSCNTLWLGTLPPDQRWSSEGPQVAPQIIDLDATHPLMMYLDFGNVTIAEARPVRGPAGQTVLLDADVGPLAVLAPRDGFEDLVLGFELVGRDEDGRTYANTDWPLRLSFPLFVRNLLEYLGGARMADELASCQPGQPVELRMETTGKSIQITSPGGERYVVRRDLDNAYLFADTDEIGVYDVRLADSSIVTQRFAVNLLDAVESDLRPREFFETAWNKITAQAGFETTRREVWRWLILLAILLLLVEWYIYNRRVYL